MRHLFLFVVTSLLFVGCQSDTESQDATDSNEETNQVSDTQDATQQDETQEDIPEINVELRTIDMQTGGYGFSFGRPEADSLQSPRAIEFVLNGEVLFSDEQNQYQFYAKNKQYYPRKLMVDDHLYYILERNDGVSVCRGFSLLSVFKFNETSFVDSCSICPLDINVDLSKVQTDEELKEIVSKCF